MAGAAATASTSGIPPAVILVTGSDAGLVSKSVREHVQRWDPDGLALEDIRGDDPDLGPVLDACVTPPFLTARRVVVFRDAARFGAEQLKPLVSYLADPLQTTVLIVEWVKETPPPKGFLDAARKAGVVEATGAGNKAADRRTWLTLQLRNAPLKVDAAAGNLLLDHLGEDVGRLPGIIENLVASYGEGARIGPTEVEPFLGGAGGVAPWDLTDAIDRGDMDQALLHLHRMITGGIGRHPLVVMASLHRHYGQMLRLDGSGAHDEVTAAQVLGMRGSTFQAKKALNQGRAMGGAGIAQAISFLAAADLQLRGTVDWSEETVMEVLVARLCRLSRTAGGRGAAQGGARDPAPRPRR